MKDLKIGVFCDSTQQGGVYNVLASFGDGLLKGFKRSGVYAVSIEDAFNNQLELNLFIGFNCFYHNIWKNILDSKARLVIWSVDSCFAQNYNVFKEYLKYDNFALLTVAKSDIQAAQHLGLPYKICYMPHGVDLDLWKKEDVKKDNDVVFFSSIYDFEQLEKNMLETLDDYQKNLFTEMLNISRIMPDFSFFQIYKIIEDNCNLHFSADTFAKFFYAITTIIENERKAKMIQSLSDFNVKVFGNPLWKKYIKGKVEYMGALDVKESVKIMQTAKISLHCHPMQLVGGLHERLLNASAVETFTLCPDDASIKTYFNNSFGYFDNSFCDISDKVDYFLTHDDERQNAARNAFETVKNNHTWKNRAESIINVL